MARFMALSCALCLISALATATAAAPKAEAAPPNGYGEFCSNNR